MDFETLLPMSLCMDQTTNSIYVTSDDDIKAIDPKSCESEYICKLYDSPYGYCLSGHRALSVVINKQLHIFGCEREEDDPYCWEKDVHIIYDLITGKLEMNYPKIPKESFGDGDISMVFIESLSKLLFVGDRGVIILYDVIEDEWDVTEDYKPLNRFFEHGTMKASVVCGGNVILFNEDEECLIIDVESKCISHLDQASLPWQYEPKSYYYKNYAFLTRGELGESEMIIHGYIRRRCPALQIPLEIVDIIVGYSGIVGTPFIHLVRKQNGEHWKINAEDLLHSDSLR